MNNKGRRPHDTADRLVIYAIVLILTLLFVNIRANAEIPGTSEAEQIRQVLSGSDIQDPEPVEDPEQQDYENQNTEAALLSQAHKIQNCTVTHYAACVECCGNTAGITASGRKATPYVSVAVDPCVIPLGSDVLVDYGDGEINYYRADDTGSGVTGSHIDLCVGSYDEAVQMGVRTATVYWIGQEADEQ